MNHRFRTGLLLAAIAASPSFLVAQPPMQSCDATPKPAWCTPSPGIDPRDGCPSTGRR